MTPQEAPPREPSVDIFARTAPARASQRALLLAIDIGTVIVPAATAGGLLVGGITWAALACGLIALAALTAYLGALARSGTSLGHVMAMARTVDARTAAPAGWQLASALVGGRLRTFDVRHGRDPIAPLLAPYEFPSVATRYTAAPVAYARPAAITLDSGQTLMLETALVIGRNPSAPVDAPAVEYEWPDLSRTLSKSHLRLEWDGEHAWAIDLGSTNGTALADGAGRTPLVPFHRTALPPIAHLTLGDRDLTVSALA